MDKKSLRAIPRPEAKAEYYELAKNCTSLKWLISASVEDGVMQLIAWDTNELKVEKENACFRMFISDDDYITQDLRTPKTKWLTGRLYSVLGIYWFSDEMASRIGFTDTESRQLVEGRFPPKSRGWSSETKSAWIAVDRWQDTVLQRRLEDRHNRELSHTNQMMELVPDVPEGFDEWIHDCAMREHRYLVYDGNSKIRMREAFCTECGSHMEIDSKNVRLRMNEWGECPCCGSTVRMKTIKRWHTNEYASKFAALAQKLEDGTVLIRCFNTSYNFEKRSGDLLRLNITKKVHRYEVARVFINGHRWESFEYAEYKQSRKTCWCPDTGQIDCGQCVLWTRNLRETLSETPYRYSGLEVLQDKEFGRQIPIFKYLRTYEKCPKLEMIVKAGLTKLALEITRDYHWNGSNYIPTELKKLSKPHMRMLRNLNGGHGMIKVIRELELLNSDTTEDALQKFLDVFGSNNSLVRRLVFAEVSLPKFTNYVMKQIGNRRKTRPDQDRASNFVHDWNDYIGWCEALGYNIRDPYVLLPPDLTKAHDRVNEEYKRMKDEQLRKAQEKMEKDVARLMKELSASDPMHMKSKKLMIMLPETVDDLKQEGQTLHHCVANYAERVAAGKTLILFVRKTDHPDEPYFTMEWRDQKVIQCRGMRNCDMTPEVKAFVTAFEKKMHEADGRLMQRQRVRVM